MPVHLIRTTNGKASPSLPISTRTILLRSDLKKSGKEYYGISHLSDIPYVFDEIAAFNNTSTAEDKSMGSQMSGG